MKAGRVHKSIDSPRPSPECTLNSQRVSLFYTATFAETGRATSHRRFGLFCIRE